MTPGIEVSVFTPGSDRRATRARISACAAWKALPRLADVHLAGRPGSNVAVFNGLARLLLDEGWADLTFLADRAAGLAELREVLAGYLLERVEQLSGVPAGALAEAARLYGDGAAPVHRLRPRRHRAQARN